MFPGFCGWQMTRMILLLGSQDTHDIQEVGSSFFEKGLAWGFKGKAITQSKTVQAGFKICLCMNERLHFWAFYHSRRIFLTVRSHEALTTKAFITQWAGVIDDAGSTVLTLMIIAEVYGNFAMCAWGEREVNAYVYLYVWIPQIVWKCVHSAVKKTFV